MPSSESPPSPPVRPHFRHAPSSTLGFVDAQPLDAALAELVPDAAERSFVMRCVIGEGPVHHRGANYVILRLLGLLADRVGAVAPTGKSLAFPMRLPPHLPQEPGERAWPVAVPSRALERLSAPGSRDFEGMIDCLTDGPPQHSVANVLMVNLIEAVLQRLEAGGPAGPPEGRE